MKKIETQRVAVEEFLFLKELAQSMGVRVWLFGGTASSFAHYVAWDLMSEKDAQSEFRRTRFDYRLIQIYRETQDLDVVIDGNEAQAVSIEEQVRARFPYFKGGRSSWEIRLLRADRGNGPASYPGSYKESLLGNSDFLEQHTDSNSVGMIELTDSREPIVRDLRQWSEPVPNFLKDVAEGKIHFYFSSAHETTKRFKAGVNPPIYSVIRYFIKLGAAELKPDRSEFANLRKIIDSNWEKSLSQIQKKWILNNGKKLISHSANIGLSLDVLQEVGLLSKLKMLAGVVNAKERNLAWWLGREALPRFKVGLGFGKTARELKIETVAHSTSDAAAFESITRSHTDIPNALISREGKAYRFFGENTAGLSGLYVKRGTVGAFPERQLDVVLRVLPDAREGTDFSVCQNNHLVILNRDAVRIVRAVPLSAEAVEQYAVQWLELDAKSKDSGEFQGLFRAALMLRHNPGVFELIAAAYFKKLETELQDTKKIFAPSLRLDKMFKIASLFSAQKKFIQRFVDFAHEHESPKLLREASAKVLATVFEAQIEAGSSSPEYESFLAWSEKASPSPLAYIGDLLASLGPSLAQSGEKSLGVFRRLGKIAVAMSLSDSGKRHYQIAEWLSTLAICGLVNQERLSEVELTFLFRLLSNLSQPDAWQIFLTPLFRDSKDRGQILDSFVAFLNRDFKTVAREERLLLRFSMARALLSQSQGLVGEKTRLEDFKKMRDQAAGDLEAAFASTALLVKSGSRFPGGAPQSIEQLAASWGPTQLLWLKVKPQEWFSRFESDALWLIRLLRSGREPLSDADIALLSGGLGAVPAVFREEYQNPHREHQRFQVDTPLSEVVSALFWLNLSSYADKPSAQSKFFKEILNYFTLRVVNEPVSSRELTAVAWRLFDAISYDRLDQFSDEGFREIYSKLSAPQRLAMIDGIEFCLEDRRFSNKLSFDNRGRLRLMLMKLKKLENCDAVLSPVAH